MFFYSHKSPYGKNVWDNCAKILSEKTNEELAPYLIELMEWLRDMNWPGALCIFDRLKKMEGELLFERLYKSCLKYAKALKDDIWQTNLKMLKK